jgi:outer membrane protein OmpA-like peptidoglycan-associated protein
MGRIAMRIGGAASLACLLLGGCGKGADKQESATANAAPAANMAAPADESAPAAPKPIADSLVSLASGAFVVGKPREYSDAYGALDLIDQDPETHWSGPRDDVQPETMVLALAGRAVLKTVQFDCAAGASSWPGACAREVSVDASDTGPDSGFSPIAAVRLEEGKDNQTFAVSAEKPARWVRLTVSNNHGSPNFIQLNDFRAGGQWLSRSPAPDISGTWDSDFGAFHVRQQGTAVTGCYYTRDGIFKGGVEARAVKFGWTEEKGTPSEAHGSVTVVVAPDGNSFTGIYWNDGRAEPEGKFSGKRKSADPGTCPNWKVGGIGEQLASDLESSGRARIQGINFDSDSDRILPESRPLLDEIVKIAKARPSWKLVVEGHTDATSTAEHNQDLSQRRARAVVAYLTGAGVEAARLTPQGFGATKPIADNGNPLGRAQNRRVELVRS